MIETNGMKVPTDMVTVSWGDDQNLTATNYFETDYCQLGLYYLCQFCWHWELLVPENVTEVIEAARGARGVIITRGLLDGEDTFQIRFIDDDEFPYIVMIDAEFVGFPPEKSEKSVEGGIFRIHQHKVGNILAVLEKVVYNEVEMLPWVPKVD